MQPGEFLYTPGRLGGGVGFFQQIGQSPAEAAAAWQAGSAKLSTEAQERASRAQQAGETERARIGAEAATAGERGKQRRFEQIFGILGGGGPGGGGLGPDTGGPLQRFFNIPGKGAVAPPGVPGSMFAPGGAGGGGGGPGGFFGGGGGLFGSPPGQTAGGITDTTLPSFGEDPFSLSQMGRSISGARAGGARQLGTELRNIEESGAGRGFAAGSPQTLARQDLARQRSMAGADTEQRGIEERYGMGRSQLEQQRQALLAQRRTDIGKEDVARRTAHFGPQSQLFSALMGAI